MNLKSNKSIVLILLMILVVSCNLIDKDNCGGDPDISQQSITLFNKKVNTEFSYICNSEIRVELIGDCFDTAIKLNKDYDEHFFCYREDSVEFYNFGILLQKNLCKSDTIIFNAIYYFSDHNDTTQFYFKHITEKNCYGPIDKYNFLFSLRKEDTIIKFNR